MRRRSRGLGYATSSKSDLKHHMTKSCGSHYWDRDTMRFFNSRLEAVYPTTNGKSSCFVTSEQFQSSAGPAFSRKYTVKKLTGCKVETVGEFQQYGSLAAARGGAKACAAGATGANLHGRRRRR